MNKPIHVFANNEYVGAVEISKFHRPTIMKEYSNFYAYWCDDDWVKYTNGRVPEIVDPEKVPSTYLALNLLL